MLIRIYKNAQTGKVPSHYSMAKNSLGPLALEDKYQIKNIMRYQKKNSTNFESSFENM